MNPVLLSSAPVFSIVELEKFKLNPFREFTNYCATNIINKLNNKCGMSLVDFYEICKADKKEAEFKLKDILKSNISDDIEINFDKPEHKKIFLECSINYKMKPIGRLKFFSHIVFLDKDKNDDIDDTLENDDNEYRACEFNFQEFNEFLHVINDDTDYISSMVYMFAKDDQNNDTIDMLVSHIKGVCEFTDFIKTFKAKSLIVKNIDMFIKKLVEPYVSDYEVYYTSDNFIISVLCGCTLHRVTCNYDNYLAQIKNLKEKLIDKYGEKYHKPDKEHKN